MKATSLSNWKCRSVNRRMTEDNRVPGRAVEETIDASLPTTRIPTCSTRNQGCGMTSQLQPYLNDSVDHSFRRFLKTRDPAEVELAVVEQLGRDKLNWAEPRDTVSERTYGGVSSYSSTVAAWIRSTSAISIAVLVVRCQYCTFAHSRQSVLKEV